MSSGEGALQCVDLVSVTAASSPMGEYAHDPGVADLEVGGVVLTWGGHDSRVRARRLRERGDWGWHSRNVSDASDGSNSPID